MAEAQQSSQLQGVTFEGNELGALLQKEFKPKTDEAKSAVEQAVQTLAQQALVNTKVIGSDVQLTVVSYKRIVEGTYWRGGSCNSRPFCAAFRAAMRAEDKVAAETLLCAYWATRSTKRLDSVLKIKTREELWRI